MPSALKVTAENVMLSNGNNALQSTTLQTALDNEMAIQLRKLLMSSVWSIKNKTTDPLYSDPVDSQVTFSADTITVNGGGKFAAAGIINEYSTPGGLCQIVTPITYQLLSNEILYINWDTQCDESGGLAHHNSSTATVVARDTDTLTMLGVVGGHGYLGIPRISILTRVP